MIYNTQSHQFKSFLDQKTLAALKIQHHWKSHSLKGKKNKFFEACTNGDLGTIKHIVESGFDINIRNDKGETPLIYAASLPDDTSQIEKIVEYLISKGWDLNAVCSEGCNALETAVAFESEVACKTLLNYKDRFDINHQSNDGTTALIESVLSQEKKSINVNIFNMLLEAGCNPSITNKSGRNVLSYLAEYGHDDAAKILFEAKTNLDLEYVNPERNETVLMIAARHGHLEMVRLLLDKGANPIHEMAYNREYKKSLAIRVLANMILARGNDEAERISELNPSATLNMHDWNVEHHFSPLTCAMSQSNNEDTQKQIVKLIYQKICEIDTENKFKKAINRFKAGPSEEGEVSQCPISGATNEPVMLVQTAQIYDRHSIDDWLSSEKNIFHSNRTCPVTNEYLYSRTVIPLRYFE